jgi:hypothetical protein
MPFLERGITGLSKMYYWHTLNAINEHENEKKKPLNKGMVCGNLGVSALAEGDVDGGIAYLLWAGQEDRWWAGDPTKNIFASHLYAQFARGTNRSGISQFGQPAPWVVLNNALMKFNARYRERFDTTSIFTELEGSPEHRALLEGAIWTIHRNLSLLREEKARGIYKSGNNVFTRLRLFDGIVTLCRFVELRMKHHESLLKLLKKNDLEEATSGTLGRLLHKVFGKGWYKAETRNIPRFEASKARALFNQFLKKKLKGKSSHVRSLLLLLVIRNYSAHICDPDVPPFFEKVEEIFDEIIAAYIYYLKFRKII